MDKPQTPIVEFGEARSAKNRQTHYGAGPEAEYDEAPRRSGSAKKSPNSLPQVVENTHYGTRRGKTKIIYLILDDIRSAQNVGAIFRTADAIGVSKIYLTGYTPAPLDRFKRERSDIAKSALGAEKNILWEEFKNPVELLKKLKKTGFFAVALEQDASAVDYKKIKPKSKTVIILGNEVNGIPRKILNKCDVVAEIPIHGKLARNRLPDDGGKESLNVSVAAGIALYGIFDRQ